MRGNVNTYLVVIDCYNLSRKNFNLEIFRRQLMEIFNYYPERQYKNYVIGVTFLVRSIYALVKPFLPARTINKVRAMANIFFEIVFVGNKEEEIKNALLQEMDIDTIPQRYGGNNPKIQK